MDQSERPAYLRAGTLDEVLVVGSSVIPDGWHTVAEIHHGHDCRVYVPLAIRPEAEVVAGYWLGMPWALATTASATSAARALRPGPRTSPGRAWIGSRRSCSRGPSTSLTSPSKPWPPS
jgi:hypothetical protein